MSTCDTKFRPSERNRPASNKLDPRTCVIIFSQENGEVLANWSDGRPQVNLGPAREVAEMMRDYLAQSELAERLLKLTAQNP